MAPLAPHTVIWAIVLLMAGSQAQTPQQAAQPQHAQPQQFQPPSQEQPQQFQPPSQEQPQQFQPSVQGQPQQFQPPPPGQPQQLQPPVQGQPQQFQPPPPAQTQQFQPPPPGQQQQFQPPVQGQPQQFQPPPPGQPQQFQPPVQGQPQQFQPPPPGQPQQFQPPVQGQPQQFQPPPPGQPHQFQPPPPGQPQQFQPPPPGHGQQFQPQQFQPPPPPGHGQQFGGGPMPGGQTFQHFEAHDIPGQPLANIAPEASNWLDSAPGVAMEYKVHVDAGKEDCYWQYVHPGATFYVSAQVLKGGDGAIGIGIRRPDGKIVHPYAWKKSTEYEEAAVTVGGFYSVCLDNQFSKFSAKLVNLYITTFRYDEWEKFAQELQEMDVTVTNFTSTLSGVDRRIQVIRQFQQLSRGLESRDFNVLLSNTSYVNIWSVIQCAIIVMSGITQVYFVKKLFGTDKPVAGRPRMRT